MKRKWIILLISAILFIAGLLLVVIFNPALTYACKTVYGNYTVFHNKPIDIELWSRLQEARQITAGSKIYDPDLKISICLNDGSKYPAMMQIIRGSAFAWGFYNNVVLMGNANCKDNFVQMNGYKWNLTQLLAHEMIHCFQFNYAGFWKSNPVARIPDWKWEGYPEYVARQKNDQKDLSKNIARLIKAETEDNNGWIQFADSTGTVIPYYSNWTLVQYCLNIKGMSYDQLLKDNTPKEIIGQQMMDWYDKDK